MKLQTLVTLSLMLSSFAFAGTRREAVRAASQLSRVSDRLADQARFGGHRNTEQGLERISRLADRAERIARRSTRAETEEAVNDIVDAYLDIRRFINNIRNDNERMRIKRGVRGAINNLGEAVFGQNFIRVYYLAPGAAQLSEEDQLDSVARGNFSGSDWDQDNGGGNDDGDGGFDQ